MDSRVRRGVNENVAPISKPEMGFNKDGASSRARPALQPVTNQLANKQQQQQQLQQPQQQQPQQSNLPVSSNGASLRPAINAHFQPVLKRKLNATAATRYVTMDPGTTQSVTHMPPPRRPLAAPKSLTASQVSLLNEQQQQQQQQLQQQQSSSGMYHNQFNSSTASVQPVSGTANAPSMIQESVSPAASDSTIEENDENLENLEDSENPNHNEMMALDRPTNLEDEYEGEGEGQANISAGAAAAAAVAAAYGGSNPHALTPVINDDSRRELAQAAEIVRRMPGMLDQDDEDVYDVSMVMEYSEDIFAYLRKIELQMLPSPHYMDHQHEIQWSMRAILIDWLVQVHHRFNLLPETLFLTINYIDRFLTIKSVNVTKLQLVGAVALFLAAKYEEINCPSVAEIAYMVDNGYHRDEILKAERYMIDLLDFNLGFPGPMSFLRRTSKADDYDLESRTLAKYLLEITIMDQRFVAAPPSWTAAAAHYLSREMLRKGEWTPAHVHFSSYTEWQLAPAVDAIRECCLNPMEHHKAIFEKYSDRKFKKAALFVNDYVQRMYQH